MIIGFQIESYELHASFLKTQRWIFDHILAQLGNHFHNGFAKLIVQISVTI